MKLLTLLILTLFCATLTFAAQPKNANKRPWNIPEGALKFASNNDPSINNKSAVSPFIVGGTAVNITDYPYQLSMFYSGSFLCGAVLISKDWVITAGHCMQSSVRSTTFQGGSATRGSGTVLTPTSQTRHPKFNISTLDYDITLYKLQTSATLSNKLAIIPLAPANITIPPNTQATVSGWGYVNFTDPRLSSNLMAVTIPTLTNINCAQTYGPNVTPRMLCAGSNGKDACMGDSGGPIVATINNVKMLIGTVSWGPNGCALPNIPGVYSNITALRDWIKSITTI